MKYYAILFTCFACGSCTSGTKPAEHSAMQAEKHMPADMMITPGKSIGKIALNQDAATVEKELGKPDQTDAAMGSALLTWYADHDTTGHYTSIFGHRNMGGADEAVLHIKKILVTSPVFKTQEGLHTGDDKNNIARYYNLQKSSDYKHNGQPVSIYADSKKGIAFEIDSVSNKCVGIAIFNIGDTPITYINMH